MKKERFKITPASYLILIKDNKILLSRRYNTGYEDGKYSFVAGHLDGKEAFRQAMAREAREEANIEIEPKDFEVVHVLHRMTDFHDVGLRERIDLFMSPKKWTGEIKNLEPHKCDDLDWFELDNLPENTLDYVVHVIKRINNNKVYSEWGF